MSLTSMCVTQSLKVVRREEKLDIPVELYQ